MSEREETSDLEEMYGGDDYIQHLAWLITDGPIRDKETIVNCLRELDEVITGRGEMFGDGAA